jgi:hypothetical protein
MTHKPRTPISFLAHYLSFFIVFMISAEAFFRWGIPARESPIPAMTPESQLRNFSPHHQREGLFTSGRRAEQRSRWQVNQWGWISHREYLPDAERKHGVVVFSGDSQVEGFYVDPDAHMSAQLEGLYGEEVLGYSLASSGYKLSAYPQVARYLRTRGVHPTAFALLVNPGDLWGSVRGWGASRRSSFPTYSISLPKEDKDAQNIAQSPSADPSMALYRAPIYPYPVSPFKRLIRHSALARYMVFNAKLNPFGIAQRRADLALHSPSLSTSPEEALLYTAQAQQVIEVVIKQIRLAQPQATLIFFGDADRKEMYKRQNDHMISPPPPLAISKWMRSICQIERNRCLWIDPTESFFAKIMTGVRVDYEHNPHWNAEGHRILAELIYRRLESSQDLPAPSAPEQENNPND